MNDVDLERVKERYARNVKLRDQKHRAVLRDKHILDTYGIKVSVYGREKSKVSAKSEGVANERVEAETHEMPLNEVEEIEESFLDDIC